MGQWVRVRSLTKDEKAAVAGTCEGFISNTLKPQFLPDIQPTEFNYPIDITGRWRGSKYSFITRFRSGFPETLGEEFDAPFARLDHAEEHLADLRFNVMWRRHTGQWRCLFPAVSLEDALEHIMSDGLLHPVV